MLYTGLAVVFFAAYSQSRINCDPHIYTQDIRHINMAWQKITHILTAWVLLVNVMNNCLCVFAFFFYHLQKLLAYSQQ